VGMLRDSACPYPAREVLTQLISVRTVIRVNSMIPIDDSMILIKDDQTATIPRFVAESSEGPLCLQLMHLCTFIGDASP